MAAQKLLDLAGIDVLAAALEHVVGAANEEHEAVLVAPHDVAGVVPAVDQAFPGVGLTVEVARHQRRRADVQHALAGVAADELQIDALARVAERARRLGDAVRMRAERNGARLRRAPAVWRLGPGGKSGRLLGR